METNDQYKTEEGFDTPLSTDDESVMSDENDYSDDVEEDHEPIDEDDLEYEQFLHVLVSLPQHTKVADIRSIMSRLG